MKIFFYSFFLILILSSCIRNTERNGYLFDLSDYQLLQEGITSKERVLKIMGSPTIISNLDVDETWIYYAESIDHILFFLPKINDRKIIALKFDADQTVRSIENIDLTHENQKMHFVSNYTEVSSNKIGFFKSLFSNVGQVKAQ
ncbi:MAG: outer membrane protein assembly factor BamE [Rickettsiales bacterium]|nr:outer membrane protein assembly factor BamE [Rickettsiales bacterium]